jgi:hypothetical protein
VSFDTVLEDTSLSQAFSGNVDISQEAFLAVMRKS